MKNADMRLPIPLDMHRKRVRTMKNRTAFKISLYGILALFVELMYVQTPGSHELFLGDIGILLGILCTFVLVPLTTTVIIAATISGVVGIIAKEKNVSILVFILGIVSVPILGIGIFILIIILSI